MSRNSSSRIYVGNLPADVREEEIDDLFYKYGRIVDIDLKLPPRSPAFCFVEFDDARDAEDAVRGRDGTKFDGHTIRASNLCKQSKVMVLCGVYTAVDALAGAFGCDMNVRGHAALKQALQLHVEEAEDD